MVLAVILSTFSDLRQSLKSESPIDFLHEFLSTYLLLALSILTSFKQFGGKPMECMVPDFFPSSWEQYAENYCWAQNTYFLPFDRNVPPDLDKREELKLSYYQWVPFFLLIQAACFRLPSLTWKWMAGHSGIKIHDLLKFAMDENNLEPKLKKENIKTLSRHLTNALRFHRRLYQKRIVPHRVFRFFNLPYSACFVSSIFLLTKLLYFFNVCMQLYLMNMFLETNKNTWYGFSSLVDIINGTSWEHSGFFPRVSLCDFKVRVMGNLHQYSVQCLLVINLFNEKIFILLWFWYSILLILSAWSFLYWATVLTLPYFGRRLISKHMELSELPFDPQQSRKAVDKFVWSYLMADGLLALRMITLHSGIIFGTDLVLALWKNFYAVEGIRYTSGDRRRKGSCVLSLEPGKPTLRIPNPTPTPPNEILL